MTLSYLPWRSPAAGTENPCIGDAGRSFNYAEVEQRAAAFAEQLAERGLAEGDVFAIKLPNGLELLIALLAAWRVGAVVTPVNPTFTERELNYQLADSHAKLLLAPAGTLTGIELITPEQMRQGSPAGQMRQPSTFEVEEREDRLALLVYTSGSTGQPKGVMLDHANLDAMAGQMRQAFRLTSEDHALLVLPLFHVNSVLVSFLTPMSVGGLCLVPAGAAMVNTDRRRRVRA